jgi:hypothetical protein
MLLRGARQPCSPGRQWVFESATATFRHAADASICLDLFSYAGDGMASLPRGAADGAAEEERQLATLDGGGALGSYACRARVPNQARVHALARACSRADMGMLSMCAVRWRCVLVMMC